MTNIIGRIDKENQPLSFSDHYAITADIANKIMQHFDNSSDEIVKFINTYAETVQIFPLNEDNRNKRSSELEAALNNLESFNTDETEINNQK